MRKKHQTVEFCTSLLYMGVQGVELMNDKWNPFDMKFEGEWSNRVKMDFKKYWIGWEKFIILLIIGLLSLLMVGIMFIFISK